jgi:hypothetical protein
VAGLGGYVSSCGTKAFRFSASLWRRAGREGVGLCFKQQIIDNIRGFKSSLAILLQEKGPFKQAKSNLGVPKILLNSKENVLSGRLA